MPPQAPPLGDSYRETDINVDSPDNSLITRAKCVKGVCQSGSLTPFGGQHIRTYLPKKGKMVADRKNVLESRQRENHQVWADFYSF